MCELVHLMAWMKEVYFIFDINISKLGVFCKVFKDNQCCIVVAKSNKLSPRKKHMAINYHNLKSFAQKKIIWICYIDTREQTAEIFTKPL